MTAPTFEKKINMQKIKIKPILISQYKTVQIFGMFSFLLLGKKDNKMQFYRVYPSARLPSQGNFFS